MANKKKNASANPNLDTVKDVFRKNRHITNRIQKKTVFEATDLSEKYYARRIKAVMHLLPEMKKRYAAKYPEMDMVSEFAEAASFPSITYDIIDWRMDVSGCCSLAARPDMGAGENAAAVRFAAERG